MSYGHLRKFQIKSVKRKCQNLLGANPVAYYSDEMSQAVQAVTIQAD